MNILAIGAHPDDIEVLCAGTLALYAQAGHKVYIAIATNGNVGSPNLTKEEISVVRFNEQKASCEIVGAEMIWMNFDDEWLFNDRQTRTVFIDVIRTAKPDIMFIHSPNDYHPDHRISSQIAEDCRIPASVKLVETALPHCEKIPHIFYMDNIAGISFEPEFYVDITSVINIKGKMIECHKSQVLWLEDLVGSTPTSIAENLARMRGQVCHTKFAEAFREIKTYPMTGSSALLPKNSL